MLCQVILKSQEVEQGRVYRECGADGADGADVFG